MKKTSSTEKIKCELIKCCINYNPKMFIPYLMSANVLTDMPNKMRFYRYFRYMIFCSKNNSKGTLSYRIEQEKIIKSEKFYYLNFYDEVHKYSRLSFEIKEFNNKIFLNTMPF